MTDPTVSVRIHARRWRRRPSILPDAPTNRRRTRIARLLRWSLFLSTLLAIGLAVRARRDNRVAADLFAGARIVGNFSLKDTAGTVVTAAAFRTHRAIVLFALDGNRPETASASSEIRDLITSYRDRGVGLYILSPNKTPHSDLGLPVLLDPAQDLIRAAGITTTPQAVVLDSDGLVLFRGSLIHVRKALDAVLAGRIPETPGSPAVGSSLPEPSPLVSPDETITYSSPIKQILQSHCVECHRPGQVGPFSLVSYRDAAKRADFLHEVTASGQMPPWRAMQGWGSFLDAHHLSRRELAQFERWAETGAPEGTPDTSSAPTEAPEWQLGPPDLVLTMAEPYAIAATGDDWRGFVLPGKLTDGRAIAAVEYKPGNRKVAHHSRVFIDSTDYSRNLDADCPGIGFSYDGRFDIPRPALVEWGPGMKLRPPPEGVAKPVKPGSDVVLLLHYHGSGKPETDQSSVGLYFAKTPPSRIMAMHTLSSNRIDIPAGEARHREIARSTVQHDIKAYSVFPHGHNLLREMKLTATLPDGQIKRLLWISDWNFAWQTQYYYSEPISLPRGTKLEVLAIYDNSANNPSNPNSPPKRVKYGPSSDEEMLGCHLYVVADDDAGDQYYRRKWEDAR
jgi:hypothetical protein